ncbi:hypothetical protein IEQ34_020056 [Dendrobium chrysotoxum]|uniref:Uncharacterized protein n=1 Tax=Dendrobium chrysotoxum TaxID=161865 RepID=A0AAV7FZX0_DENCH|nr:hypothetical protein IEQ34_020056 [Dendrobium chrysotoxum]
MDAGGVEVAPEERIYSSLSSTGCDSEKWETSEDEGRGTKSRSRVLPDGFLDPLPPQKPFKLPRLSDIQCMPLGIRVHIEVNENGVPCNISESILLGSYMGHVARDSVLAPISFSDWRNKGMEPFKKKIRSDEATLQYVDQTVCCKMPLNEVNMEEEKAHACKMLAKEGLTPEDGNLEANERVFKAIMGPEYPGRVRIQEFGVTPTRYFPQSTTHRGNNSSSNAFACVARLEEQLQTL